MAQPITVFQVSKGETNVEARLPTLARDHAEAVESAYELLQLLYDRGVLDLLRGLLDAGDRVVDTLVEAVDTPESIRGIRNFLLLTKFFGSIRPEILNSMVQAVTEGAKKEKAHKAPGFFELYRRLHSEDTRHALSVTLDLLESVGKGL
jgi:uncharacterized protein YjgD (DUF1641 family)